MAISLSEQLESDIKEYLHKTFGTYFSSLDERFAADIKEDVINTSDFHHGSYNDDDISIAFQRVTLGRMGHPDWQIYHLCTDTEANTMKQNVKVNTPIHIRPASHEEAGLFYSQMKETEDAALGTVGHVRMDFGSSGKGFYHTWWPHNDDQFNTKEFKGELQEVVDALRADGPLKDLASMRSYCYRNGGELTEDGRCYGYVVDTEHYRYCLRCTPSPGDYQGYLYTMIAGTVGGGSYSGEYLRGDGSSIELDISAFTDPTTKNAADLVTYAIHAWESGWGYVWGTYGNVLTDSLFAYKLEQYPDGVGAYADFIRANWLGGRTTDCVGLIKGYGWLNPDTMTIEYGTNGMPDLGANQMYYNASVSGTIDTMPDIPGLAVWHDGHIGVYIGDGYVIEAMGTKYGVVKTELEGRGWTHWLQIEYINYD